jgi:hypothetical protein
MFTANDGESVFEFGDPGGCDGEGDEVLIRACERVQFLARLMRGETSELFAEVKDLELEWLAAVARVSQLDASSTGGILATKIALDAIMGVYENEYNGSVNMIIQRFCKGVERELLARERGGAAAI